MSEENVPVVEEVVNPAFVKLSNVIENVCVTDMNYLFHYERLKLPNDVYSNYFALHYKEAQQEVWSTCRNLLSKDFTVAKTAVVIDQIKTNLGGTITGERHYRNNTSVRSTFVLDQFQLTGVADEPEIDLVLFNLLTNVVATEVSQNVPKLTFNIINGFSGNLALMLNYGVLKSIRRTADSVASDVTLNNVFLLDNFTNRIIHNERLNVNIADVANVQQHVADQINTFKSHQVSTYDFEQLMLAMPKKVSKKFEAMFNSLPDTLRSWYYCSYVLTAVLDSEKSIPLEIKLRDLVKTRLAAYAAPLVDV